MLELVQTALGTRKGLSSPPASLDQWQAVLREVVEHSLVGITFPAVEKLGQEMEVPPEIGFPWSMAVDEIRRKNARQKEMVAQLNTLFQEAGFRCCLLKGQVSASLYPDPSLRQSGDIDIWLDRGRERIMEYLRANYAIERTRYIHCEARILGKKPLEVHFTPSWMFSPFANRNLQKWFASQAEEQFSSFDEGLGVCTPTLRFNGVYMLLHIFRHVFEEGIGLRQLMDYYFLLTHLDADDRAAVCRDLRHLGLWRFAGGLMYALEKAFLMDEGIMLCPPDKRLGTVLLEKVMVSGNFGHSDPVFANRESKTEGILAHGWRKIKRNLGMLRISPSEVLWMPIFVTWQYFWRKKNGYLYKGR